MRQEDVRAEALHMIEEFGGDDAGRMARHNEYMLEPGSEPRRTWMALANEIEVITGVHWVFREEPASVAGSAPALSTGVLRTAFLGALPIALGLGWVLFG